MKLVIKTMLLIVWVNQVYAQSCPANRAFSNDTHTSVEHYQAAEWITSTNTTSTVGADVIYKAGNYVELNEGFLAEYGTVFEAFIEACDSTICENDNGDMETYTGVLTDNNTFINNNVPNWFVSHGTPNYDGEEFAYIWSYGGNGEGVYTNYAFVPGQTYQLTFDVWLQSTSLPASTVNVRLSNNLSPSTGNTGIPPATGTQLVHTQGWSPTGWNTVSITFTPNMNYSELWFYPFLASSASSLAEQAVIKLDNVCVVTVEPCCVDQAVFYDRVDDGFTAVIDESTCSINIEPINLDDCHFVAWDFGDGTVTGYNPAPSSNLTHSYNGSGQYQVCMFVHEIDAQGQVCWEGAYCETIQLDCSLCENANGDLNTFTGVLADNNTFINNNVPNWSVSHGTPNYDGAKFAYIWSYNGNGEGVYTDHAFVLGQTYQLTFDVWLQSTSLPASTVNVRLSNNLSPSTGNTGVPSAAGTQLIYTQGWSPTGWNTVSLTFTPNMNYSQLWCYPFLASSASSLAEQAVIKLDNVCIEELNTCPPILTLNEIPILDGLYQAGEVVNSAGQVPTNGTVQFKASQYIMLDVNFTVEPDADFSAEIDDCPY